VQFWLPDVRSKAFIAEAHRQSVAVARADAASAEMDFIESVIDWAE
jgi:hypothetical protein